MLNGFVGFVVSGLEFRVGPMGGIGFVMKTAVGQWSAKAFVKEEKQQCDLDSLGGEVVAVSGAITLKKTMAFEFAQVITELIETVSICRKAE